MDEIRKFEYEKAYESMRFFLEYRLKAFGFFVVANGLLIAAVSTHTNNLWEKSALSGFAIVIGITIHLFDIRIMNLAKDYRQVAVETARDIEASNLSKIHEDSARDRGVTLDNLFKVVDRFVISVWSVYFLAVAIKFVISGNT